MGLVGHALLGPTPKAPGFLGLAPDCSYLISSQVMLMEGGGWQGVEWGGHTVLINKPYPALRPSSSSPFPRGSLWKFQPVLIPLCSSRPPRALEVVWWSESGERALRGQRDGQCGTSSFAVSLHHISSERQRHTPVTSHYPGGILRVLGELDLFHS